MSEIVAYKAVWETEQQYVYDETTAEDEVAEEEEGEEEGGETA